MRIYACVTLVSEKRTTLVVLLFDNGSAYIPVVGIS